jgi:death on curing protein
MREIEYLIADDVLALVEWVFPRVLRFQPPILRGGGRALLESAKARAQHAAFYGQADLIEQAAALTNGIARNQPFVDGNKRTAWTVCRAFLELNGQPLAPDSLVELAEQLIRLSQMTEHAAADAELIAWLRAHLAASG